jgi:hypothetical protein
MLKSWNPFIFKWTVPTSKQIHFITQLQEAKSTNYLLMFYLTSIVSLFLFTVNIDSLVLPPTPPSSSNSDSDSCSSPQRSAPSSPVRHLPYSRQLDRHSSYSSSLSPTGSSRHYSHSLYSSSSQVRTYFLFATCISRFHYASFLFVQVFCASW